MRIIFTHSELEQRWNRIKKVGRILSFFTMVLTLCFFATICYMGWEINGGIASSNDQFDAVAKVYSSKGTGSAFYIGNSYALSASHVVGTDPTVKLDFEKGGFTCEAIILHTDEQLDITLLRIPEPPGITPLTIGDSDLVSLGETVLTTGYPLGNFSVTKGIISNTTESRIKTDAAINPGNSGGPMITEEMKEVIGIIVSTGLISEGVRADGSANAIAITRVKEALADAGYII